MNRLDTKLILSAHPDDGLLSAGGLLAKYPKATYVVFSWKGQGFKMAQIKEALKDFKTMFFDFPVRRFDSHRQDILDMMWCLKKSEDPDIVITHSTFDNHQDHKVIREETFRAFKDRTILGFDEEWNCINFDARYFVKLSKGDINKKIKRLAPIKQERRYYNPKVIEAKARERGNRINSSYAEAYELIREII